MESHPIAVISDTHGILRPEVVQHIEACEAVFHGGDMDNPEILRRLQALRPVYAVAGNADADWAGGVPGELTAELYGFRFYMIHNRRQIRRNLSDYDIVICGHSHKYQEGREGGTYYLNPGSCGRRRFRLPLTMMILTLYPGTHEIAVQRIDLPLPPASSSAPSASPPGPSASPPGPSASSPALSASPLASAASSPALSSSPSAPSAGEPGQSLSERDMHKLVKLVMRDMDAGRPVPDIAARTGADPALVEQICRMYATHPGVDVDGILDRLERRNL